MDRTSEFRRRGGCEAKSKSVEGGSWLYVFIPSRVRHCPSLSFFGSMSTRHGGHMLANDNAVSGVSAEEVDNVTRGQQC